MNGAIHSITKQSSTTFSISIVPSMPGFFSVTLSKSITSISGDTLINPPILEFNYLGCEITSKRVTTITTSSITVTITTSKPSYLFGLISSTPMQTSPSSSTIISQAQASSEQLSTSHLLQFTNLEEDTKYTIYLAGKEELGTLLVIDEQLTAQTKSSSAPDEEDWDSKSDGTLCKSGWAVSKDTNSLELLACSYKGYCQQSKCM